MLLHATTAPTRAIRSPLSASSCRSSTQLCGDRDQICAAAVTGYGEELIKNAFRVDYGMVETVAHFTRARSAFSPDVDFILDIGGQDIKCFKIRNGAIDNIYAQRGLLLRLRLVHRRPLPARWATRWRSSQSWACSPKRPVDLGSRCTVFMNSSVKQAQKDGATRRGHFRRPVDQRRQKRDLQGHPRADSPTELGKDIVVQGGTFLNDAVLRGL